MNIKEFRIKENALSGFYIQRLFKKTNTVKSFWFWQKPKVIESEAWKNITENGSEPFSSFFRGASFRLDPMEPFETKQEAIDYLEKLCAPNKFYYPDKFE